MHWFKQPSVYIYVCIYVAQKQISPEVPDMFQYLTTILNETGRLAWNLFVRLNLTSFNIALCAFNLIFTWSVYRYLTEARNQLLYSQFASRREIRKDNSEF